MQWKEPKGNEQQNVLQWDIRCCKQSCCCMRALDTMLLLLLLLTLFRLFRLHCNDNWISFFFSFIPSSLVLLLLLYALYCRIALNNTSAPFANMAYLLSHCCVVAIFVVATTFYSRVFRFTFGSYYLCALCVVYAQKSQPSFAC